MEHDLSTSRERVNGLLSTKINLIKSDADSIAQRLLQADSVRGMAEMMAEQKHEFPEFIAFAVFDRDGVIARYGANAAPESLQEESRNMRLAFDGVKAIGTTEYHPETGNFIMYVYVPMGPDKVLAATMPGDHIASTALVFKLSETRDIFVVDNEGTIIASFNKDLYLDRRNFIKEKETNT
jgi:hypothetical protein